MARATTTSEGKADPPLCEGQPKNNSYNKCKNEMLGLSTTAAGAPPPVEMTAFC
jgi:hypothetical protein